MEYSSIYFCDNVTSLWNFSLYCNVMLQQYSVGRNYRKSQNVMISGSPAKIRTE